MGKKCESFCDARHSNLWLRGNVFYFIMEAPRVNGKRRYIRISLKTGDYYEAMAIVKSTKIRMKGGHPDFKQIHDELKEFHDMLANPSAQLKSSIHIAKMAMAQQEEFGVLTTRYEELKKIPFEQMTTMQRQMLETLKHQLSLTPVKPPTPVRKISDVLEAMLLRAQNVPEESQRKRQYIEKLLKEVGLRLDSDYSEFHNETIIKAISKNILARTDIKGDAQKTYIRYIKDLMTYASELYPDDYKSNIALILPKVKKTSKTERNPHQPYTEAQLLEMFDPKHEFFEKNPDIFYACLIAMFTGARANAATTIQFDDIYTKDGIPCVEFRKNHEIKRLKNEASERIVPINPQLLDLGFLDYIKRNQKARKATGKEFVFEKCITRNGTHNEKYPIRDFGKFLESIGIRDGGKFDFHSFRKNANGMMDNVIPGTYINAIIGWEGKDTREQSYTHYSLAQIKAQVDKCEYAYLKPHFAKWKKIMTEK